MSHTCHGAGAAVGPARPTVLGNVLVASCADVVGAIDVPPVPGLGQVSDVQILMGTRGGPVGRQVIRRSSHQSITQDTHVVNGLFIFY